MYTFLHPIRPYVAPQYLIEPVGDPIVGQDNIDAELDAAEYRGAGPTVVEPSLQGWEPYTEIIVCTDEHDEDRYYLAG